MERSLHLPPWVDLPDLVTELILEHLPLPDYIRFAAVCRRWGSIQKDHRLRHSPHPPPMGPHPLPWLIPYGIQPGTGFDCYSPLEKKVHRVRFPTTPTFAGSIHCIASSRGWLLMLDPHDADFHIDEDKPFLFNPLTGAVISLPFVLGCYPCGALSSPPYDPDCTILLASFRGSVFLHRSNDPGDGWTLVGPVGEIRECVDYVVYCGGKFYGISGEGDLYIIDGVRSTPTPLRLTMDVSSLDRRDGDVCRLVEFGGELLLIMELYDLHDCLEGFQVFRADISGEKWVKKVDMLADHVLFLDNLWSSSLLAADVGCKKNLIYCTHGHQNHAWRVFDLDTGNWIDGETTRRGRFIDQFRPAGWFLPTLG